MKTEQHETTNLPTTNMIILQSHEQLNRWGDTQRKWNSYVVSLNDILLNSLGRED